VLITKLTGFKLFTGLYKNRLFNRTRINPLKQLGIEKKMGEKRCYLKMYIIVKKLRQLD